MSPRLYAAFRLNHLSGDHGVWRTIYETAIGYRPNRFQLLKIGYERQNGPTTAGALGDVFSLQLVTRMPTVAITRN